MTEATAVPVVLRDVFPATVTTEGGQYRSALAVITEDRLMVWVTRAAPILDAPYDRDRSRIPRGSAPRSATAHLVLASGQVVSVAGQRGCGCGNPLKGWRPWRPWRKAAA